MIDQLIAALNQEVDLSAEEIADTIWLAMHMEQSGVDSVSSKSPNSKPDPETTEDNSKQHSQPDLANKSRTQTSTEEEKSTEKEQKSDRAGVYHQKPEQSQKSLDIPFKVPDAPCLREELDLARALRPLMRRIPSGSTLVLDEAATSQRIADEGIWLPVIKPTLEPWLDLELVVDEAISMQIWRHTIKELERLLANYGIFRDVRVWGLISNEQNKIQIRRGIGGTAKNQSPRSAAELIDSSGRRLVLVVSDCVSDLWRSGAVNLALKTWANNVPTAIIQMLPQWLWGRTALGRATEVKFQGLAPSVSNRQLIANTVSLWSKIDDATGIKVPVFTLEPERVSKWAQMLVGKGSIQASGFVLKPEIRNLELDKPLFNLDRDKLTAEQRVQAFRVTASPMARKLAGLLASAPVISLPVVRLIQETMLADSQQVHVAEVFLGGLLKPLSEIEIDTDPGYVQYGFIDGVRELLVDSVPSSYVLNVVEEVSKFVAKKIGLSLSDFAAVLRNSGEISDSKVFEQVQPFAMVTAEILRCLGGEYAKFADELNFNKISNPIKYFNSNTHENKLDLILKEIQESSNKIKQRTLIETLVNLLLQTRTICKKYQGQPLKGIFLDIYLLAKIELLQEVEKEINKKLSSQSISIQLLCQIQNYVFKKVLDEDKLKKIALFAQQHPKHSSIRNYALTELIKAIKLSGRLIRPHRTILEGDFYELLYEEAMAETLAYVCEKIDNYEPDRGNGKFMNWVNFKLDKTLLKNRQFYDIEYIYKSSLDKDIIEVLEDKSLPSKSNILYDYIIDDPLKILRNCHIKSNPEANFRAICLDRLNGETWREISKKYDVSIPIISSFFRRQTSNFNVLFRDQLNYYN